MGQALKRGYEVLPDNNVWFAMTDGAPTVGSVWEGDGTYRAIRGGGWVSIARNCRSANRNHNDPRNCDNNLGFRILQCIVMPEVHRLWMVCQCVDDDQISEITRESHLKYASFVSL